MIKHVDYGWNAPKTHAHEYLLGTVKTILKGLSIPKTFRILDAGCGGGYVMADLYKIGYENTWGFDASESGIKIAKENFREIQNRFAIHSAYEVILPDTFSQKEYDTVLSAEVIEHLYSPKTYLVNIHSWLKQGGYLILTTPYHGYLKNLVVSLLNGFDKHVNPLWEGGHIKFFSSKTLSKLLEESGFRQLKFYGSGRIPYLWKSMVFVAQKK